MYINSYLSCCTERVSFNNTVIYEPEVITGINKIDGFVKNIATMEGLDITKKHFTNHSVRKSTVRKLQKAGVSNDRIIAITGHKTEQSIKVHMDTDLESSC